MKRFRKVPHHSLSATSDHKQCTSIHGWCKVRELGDEFYKSDKFRIKGAAQILPVSKKANEELIKMWDTYFTWPFIKACIYGKLTNGTQANESFNHVRAKFTNKMISIKDNLHWKGQCYAAALQYNEGYGAIGDKLERWGYIVTDYQKKVISNLDRKRQKTKEIHDDPKYKAKRKRRRCNLIKANKDDNEEYGSNKYCE